MLSRKGDFHMDRSRYLNNRIIIIDEEINDKNASIIVAQLIYLNEKSSTEDIYILINSPGDKLHQVCNI